MIEPSDLIFVAFFSGIGTVFGQAVGKWIHDKMQKHKEEIMKNEIVKEVLELIPQKRR